MIAIRQCPTRWLAAFALLWLTANAGASDRADTHAQAREAGSAALTVLWVASPGWAEVGPDGQPEGVSIELMRRFGRWLEQDQGLAVQLDFVEEDNWTRFYARVRDASGGVFGMGNVTITEPRRAELQFSPPYARNVGVLITPTDIGEFASGQEIPDRLGGLRALAFADTLHEQRLRELSARYWPEMPIDFTRSNDEILERVAAGSHFAYIDGYHYLRALDEGQALKRHPAFDAGDERFGIIMPLDSDWALLLAQFFREAEGGLLASDWYRDLFERYLGRETAELMRALPGD